MAKINLTCDKCGGQCAFDEKLEKGFCQFCGNKMVIKDDVINNIYNTTNHTTQNITKNLYASKDKDADDLVKDGLKLFELGDIQKANKKFEQAIDIQPDNWYAWFGFAKTNGNNHKTTKSYLNAYRLAKEGGNAQGCKEIIDYLMKMNTKCCVLALDEIKPPTPDDLHELARRKAIAKTNRLASFKILFWILALLQFVNGVVWIILFTSFRSIYGEYISGKADTYYLIAIPILTAAILAASIYIFVKKKYPLGLTLMGIILGLTIISLVIGQTL